MKTSTKAVLISAFIFPGLGHIFLKKYPLGVALIAASFSAVYYLVSTTIEKALQIAEKIQTGEVQLDAEVIADLVSKQSEADTQLLSIATLTFFICWLVGVVDAYRLGSAKDKENDLLIER